MTTQESPVVGATAAGGGVDDPGETQIWEEAFWDGELDPALRGALKEKFGAAGEALVEGAAADPANLVSRTRGDTEREILVEQLVKVNRRLQRRTQQQHQQLEKHRRRLAAANRAKDLLLSRTGHDVRNGIGSILAHTTLAWAASGGAAADQLDNIEETCQHLLQLLDGLVDQAALASGVFSVRPISFALEDLVTSVAKELREGRLQRKDQRLVVPEAAESHVVHADPRRLTQVLRNYVENASKFSEPGTTVELRFEVRGESIAVEVLDEGPGIPESALEWLFEPMADIGNSPTDGETSTGLGLTVVADIVQRHGGEVWGQNREGGGAVFGFSLPLVTDDDAEPITWSLD